jgi:hypothetical protein
MQLTFFAAHFVNESGKRGKGCVIRLDKHKACASCVSICTFVPGKQEN